MWETERDKIAGWWKGRQAAGGDDRTEVRNYTGEGGRHPRGCSEETETVATYGDADAGEGGAAATESGGEDGSCIDGGVGVEVGRDAVTDVSGRGDCASKLATPWAWRGIPRGQIGGGGRYTRDHGASTRS